MARKTLESELQRLNPELYQNYLQTQEEAINRWLPNIQPKDGSFNSYPHIKGVMEQLNTILYDNENSIELNSTEIYLLLLAVFLHDIGKAKNVSGTEDPGHGIHSMDYIDKRWAELKIVNKQLSQILKYICALHDRSDSGDVKTIKSFLHNNTYIDRYGNVRGILLGALLFLADHMDGSFTRTAPDDLSATFRSKVLGIRWLPKQQMICTCIDYIAFLESSKEKNCESIESCKDEGALYKYIAKSADKNILNKQEPYKYIHKQDLYEIIKDVYVNNEAIKLIKDELYSMGITPVFAPIFQRCQ